MANKNQKANDANWMAILQAFQGTPEGMATAIGATLQSDIKRDRADKGDINRTVANAIYAQAGDPNTFLNQMLNEHPEMIDEMDDYLDKHQIVLSNLQALVPIIPQFLKSRGYKFAEGGQFEEIEGFVNVTINNVNYKLLHLISDEEKEVGLKNVVELDQHEGALFDYSDEPQSSLSFWMQDTEIPLLICFMNESGKVISVHKGTPMSEEPITESSEFIAYVIEVGVNENIHPGDQTSLGQKQDIIDDEDGEDDLDEYPDLKINKLVVYGSDGNPQAFLQGGERIFSRKSTRVILRKAKKAYMTKEDVDYKALGRYVFKEMDAQDSRDPEYVEN